MMKIGDRFWLVDSNFEFGRSGRLNMSRCRTPGGPIEFVVTSVRYELRNRSDGYIITYESAKYKEVYTHWFMDEKFINDGSPVFWRAPGTKLTWTYEAAVEIWNNILENKRDEFRSVFDKVCGKLDSLKL